MCPINNVFVNFHLLFSLIIPKESQQGEGKCEKILKFDFWCVPLGNVYVNFYLLKKIKGFSPFRMVEKCGKYQEKLILYSWAFCLYSYLSKDQLLIVL